MKEIIKRKIDLLDGEHFFCLLLWAALAGLIWYCGLVMTADRTPNGYYLSSYSTEAGIAYKIKISINYMDDPTAFSTHDYKVVLDTLDRLNGATNRQ